MFGQTIAGKTLSQRYHIITLLGKGSFGETYLAEDTHLPSHPKLVVKRLKPQYTDPEDLKLARRLFDTEVETLYKLGNHNQIPKLFDRFEEQQEFYLVQEYIEGPDLTKEIILGKQLPETEVIKLMQEITEVMAFVHQQNIIHRDLKPSNLMRRAEDGKIVIIDFGAVKEISSTQLQNNQKRTVMIGSPGYMPPEQINGVPQLCSDVYALGMLGIQALTGISPDRLPKNHQGVVQWPDSIKVSPGFARVLTSMVQENNAVRLPDASQALSALKAIAPAPTVISGKTRRPIAYKLMIVVMGLMALGAIGLTIYLSYKQPEAAPTPEEETCKNPPCVW